VTGFTFYAESNEKKQLAWNLTQLPAEHLKFVVDSAVSLDELRWAQKQVRNPKSDFSGVYSSIRYDEERVNAQTFHWPYPVYSLADIRKNGGICIDQAYFAWLAGKANGIPTLLFMERGAVASTPGSAI